MAPNHIKKVIFIKITKAAHIKTNMNGCIVLLKQNLSRMQEIRHYILLTELQIFPSFLGSRNFENDQVTYPLIRQFHFKNILKNSFSDIYFLWGELDSLIKLVNDDKYPSNTYTDLQENKGNCQGPKTNGELETRVIN